jgi:hypothetical protein
MMRNLVAVTLLIGFLVPSAGCIVRDRGPRHRTVVKEHKKTCGPAHHWNGYTCVHNGKAKGHRK